MKRLLLFALGLAAVAEGAAPRLNDMQLLGTHNSYHIAPARMIRKIVSLSGRVDGRSLDYTHQKLAVQLGKFNVRQVELDVYADPEGGRFTKRLVNLLLGKSPTASERVMYRRGFKVLHFPDIDFNSNCLTLQLCLLELRKWSEANVRHLPLVIWIELKEESLAQHLPAFLGFGVTKLFPTTAAIVSSLDTEIRGVFPRNKIIIPDDVRGDERTLEAAVLNNQWPTIESARGKVLFVLDSSDSARALYVQNHVALRNCQLFVLAPVGTPEAAIINLTDPLEGNTRTQIAELVKRGYIVRTRSDGDTMNARKGDTRQREAALASGAQIVSTDYPVPDSRFSSKYFVQIPGGHPARCNPLRSVNDCTPADVSEPSVQQSASR